MAGVVGKINVLGLGSGLDLQGLIDQLRQIEEKPIERMKETQDRYETRLNEFDWLNTKVLSLKSKTLDLSLESTYLTKKISVSGDAVTGRAEVGALEGTYNISVSQLARKSLWQSQGYATKDADIAPSADDVLQISVGDQNFSVLVPQGTTLEGLARLINEAEDNPGLEAKVVDTGAPSNPYRLVLKARDTGEENRVVVTQELQGMAFEEITAVPNIWRTGNYTNPDDVVNDSGGPITLNIEVGSQSLNVEVADGTTLSGLVDLINEAAENTSLRAYLIRDKDGNYFVDLRAPEPLNVTQDPADPALFPNQIEDDGESLNAFFTLDDISYQRGANTVDDLIPGVVLELKKAGTATVEVTADQDGLKELISSFVNDLKEFFKELNEKMSFNVETGEEGPLYRSRAAESLLRDLRDVLFTVNPENEHVKSFFDLGLNFNRDGSLSFDEKKLENALSSYPEEVKKLLLGDDDQNITGVGEKFNNVLQKYLGPSGLIALEQKTTEKYIENLKNDISLAQKRVDQYISYLQKQFIALDRYIQQLNDMSSYLDVQFKSIMGLSEKK